MVVPAANLKVMASEVLFERHTLLGQTAPIWGGCQRAAESPHFGARNFPHLAGWRSAVCVISASVFGGSTAALDRRVRGRRLDQSIRADVLGNKIGVLTEAVA